MKKSELINEVSRDMGVTKKIGKKAVNSVMRKIREGMKLENRVELLGFGTFTVRKVPSQYRQNPRTGERIFVGEKVTPKFKASGSLKDYLNGREV